jgi:hypothetical protein
LIQRQEKMTDKILSKKQLHVARKDEVVNQIRGLGVLPENAFDQFKSKSNKEVGSVTFSILADCSQAS